jgi:hypothetical protein
MSESAGSGVDEGGLAPCYRPVRPPRKVWIKATKLWAKDHGELYSNKPDGVVLDREVLGGLTGQVLRADGGWLAEVTFQLHSANGHWHSPLYTQLVPSHLVRWANSTARDPYADLLH